MMRTLDKITYAYLIGLDDGYVSFRKLAPECAGIAGPTRERMLGEGGKHARHTRGFWKRSLFGPVLINVTGAWVGMYTYPLFKSGRIGEALFVILIFFVFWLAVGPRVMSPFYRWLIGARLSRERCMRCTYDLSGVPERDGWIICPECGLDVPGEGFEGQPSPAEGRDRAPIRGDSGLHDAVVNRSD